MLRRFSQSKYVSFAFGGLRPAATGLIAAAAWGVVSIVLFNFSAFASGGIAAVFNIGAAAVFILFLARPAWLLTAFNAVLDALALFEPFKDIVGGMFSIPAIVYYLSVIGLFLFMTGQALERRRWN